MKSSFLQGLLIVAFSGWLPNGALRAAPPTSFAGGDGSNMEKAVVIKGGDEMTGVAAEDTYIARHFPGYKKVSQKLFSKDKRQFDQIDFTTAKGEKKSLFFDITGFFGKM